MLGQKKVAEPEAEAQKVTGWATYLEIRVPSLLLDPAVSHGKETHV